ncbi:MAG: dihydrodipicolinate synthase family protein [Paracoccaceae bacterium]
MKTSTVTFEDLSASVMAVPPLARHADLRLNREENRKLVDHLEAGGIRTLLWGGNANFYNLPLSEYVETLEFLAQTARVDTWVIPSAGPDFGRLMDQARVLRDMPFPTVMALPQQFPATPSGVEKGLRRFAERLGKPITLYLKFEGYLTPKGVQRLILEEVVCGIKYAIVRRDPAQDDYLRGLLDLIDRKYLVSGIGERPAVVHVRDFGLNGFTSGSVCLAPRASTALLKALKTGDYERAETLRAAFLPLEDLRDAISPIRVLHDAVTLAGIADMGPILPLLHNLEEEHRPEVAKAAKELSAVDQTV